MSLDQKINDFLAHADARPAPSKLEPYADLIRALRQRRWSYVEIAKALCDDFGIQAHPTTVHSFVKVRGKSKSGLAMSAPDHAAPFLPVPASTSQSGSGKRPRFHLDA
jgi:hypothetical protein